MKRLDPTRSSLGQRDRFASFALQGGLRRETLIAVSISLNLNDAEAPVITRCAHSPMQCLHNKEHREAV